MKRSPLPARTHEEFVFQISAPSLSYSFGINTDRRSTATFEERHSLEFQSHCLWPSRYSGRPARATVYPEPDLLDEKLLEPDDTRRKWIGYIRLAKAHFEIVVWLPPPVCWHLGAAMTSGLVGSMLTNGLIETRSMNRVTWVSFHGSDFDAVEYVG